MGTHWNLWELGRSIYSVNEATCTMNSKCHTSSLFYLERLYIEMVDCWVDCREGSSRSRFLVAFIVDESNESIIVDSIIRRSP